MKHILAPLVLMLGLAALPVAAEPCFADYKAKQDDPLRLHYGVIELRDGCAPASARNEVTARLKRNGWTLLGVLSVFGPDGLEERKADAGP